MRNLSTFLALLLTASAANATSTVVVNAPPPAPQYTNSDTSFTLYYAGNETGTVASTNTAPGYRVIAMNGPAASNLIYVDVSTTKSFTLDSGTTLAVSISKSTNSSPVTLTGASLASSTNTAPSACSSGVNCHSNGYSALLGTSYVSGTVYRLSFSLDALCASVQGTLCNNRTSSGNTFSETFYVTFGQVNTSTNTLPTDNTSDKVAQASATLSITDIVPTISGCPAVTDAYFPGDGEVYLQASKFSASANSGAPLQYLIAMAKPGGSIGDGPTGVSSNPIVSYVDASASQATVTGFTNTTNNSDNDYTMIVQSQNRAGIMSTGTDCQFSPVRSQSISGVLKESKCFIATAAFQNGRAAPVMMLRKFRDRILSQFSLGRSFIEQYYTYSPALAEWAWDKPIIRSFALRLLAPVELMAWVVLKVSEAQIVDAATAENPEAYIDRLKKQLEAESDTHAPVGSYTESEKKRLEQESPSKKTDESYTDKLKKDLGNEETSSGYTSKEKANLPAEAERESPIQMVKEGRDQKLGLGKTDQIAHAAGFKLGVTPGMNVAVAGGSHTFEEVYGTGWQPELMFHYERQLFHSENYGSFGLGTDLGVSYAGGKGLLQFGFGTSGSKTSLTGFSFLQVPVIVSGTYRFNLLRILRPYATAGAGAIFYDEIRNDNKGDKKGYTAIYTGSAGVSLLLDFLDSKTHTDSYLGTGIQHTYLFLEYLYLNSFKSSVAFNRSGIYSGFLFEF